MGPGAAAPGGCPGHLMGHTKPPTTASAAGQTGVVDVIFSGLAESDHTETDVLMLDATSQRASHGVQPQQRGSEPRLIVRTKGVTSTLHVVWDSQGDPLQLHRSEAECSNSPGADVLLKDLSPATALMGGKGYGATKSVGSWRIRPCHPASHSATTTGKSLILARGYTPCGQNRESICPTEGLAAHSNTLRSLWSCFPLCYPLGCYWP